MEGMGTMVFAYICMESLYEKFDGCWIVKAFINVIDYIIMKPHVAYSRELIDKYLKIKRDESTVTRILPKGQSQICPAHSLPSKTTVIVIESVLSVPPSHEPKDSSGGNNKAIMDRIQMVKQRYLKRSVENKAEIANAIPQQQSISTLEKQNNMRKLDFLQSESTFMKINQKMPTKNTQASPKFVAIQKSLDEIGINPLKSSIVQQIILKRLRQTLQTSPSTSLSQNYDQNENEGSQATFLQDQAKPQVMKTCTDMILDEEYGDADASCDINTVSQVKSRSLQQQIHLWIHSPATLLSEVIPTSSSDFVFTSTNKSFSPAIAQMIGEFVLRGRGQLGQGQRRALYHIALEYFYRNTSELTAELLIVLVKLGRRYLVENAQFFTHNVEKYCKIIVKNRYMFSVEERATIVNFLIQQGTLDQKKIGCLLLVHPTEKLINCLFSRPFSMSETLFLLCCLSVSRKEFPHLAEIYLRLICTMSESLPREKELIEQVLGHVMEVSTSEAHYHVQKQVKLKLIKLLSDGQGQAKAQKGERTGSRFIGYWSKAVDKIKTATTQLKE